VRELGLKPIPAAVGWIGMLWVSPAAALACLAVGGGLWLLTRSLALSVCLAALTFPFGVWLIDHPGYWRLIPADVLAIGLAWIYRDGLRAEP
jgi:hypothetical protein